MIHSLTLSIARRWCWADLAHRNRIPKLYGFKPSHNVI